MSIYLLSLSTFNNFHKKNMKNISYVKKLSNEANLIPANVGKIVSTTERIIKIAGQKDLAKVEDIISTLYTLSVQNRLDEVKEALKFWRRQTT